MTKGSFYAVHSRSSLFSTLKAKSIFIEGERNVINENERITVHIIFNI